MCGYINCNMFFFHSAMPFVFYGKEINAEKFWNILLGYIGNAGNYSKVELIGISSLYSLYDSGALDDDSDSNMIAYGFDLYESRKRNYLYIHLMEE